MRSESTPMLSDDEWEQLKPLLEDLVAKLPAKEREAVLLRFYQHRSLGEVGREMGTSEEAARKRVDRGVEKLRKLLTRRGIAPTAAGLAAGLMAKATVAAPAGLAASVTAAVSGGTVSASAVRIAEGVKIMMTLAKVKAVAVIVGSVALLAWTGVVVQRLVTNASAAPGVATTQPVNNRPPVKSPPATRGDDSVHPGDRLTVSIFDLTAPNVVTAMGRRVDADGRISLPLVGQINLRGQTLADAPKLIIKFYRDANLMRNADVAVERTEAFDNASVRVGPIAAGDSVRIRMWDVEAVGQETAIVQLVPPDGRLKFPVLGLLPVTGLTEFQAEQAISRAYREANLVTRLLLTVERISAAEVAAGGRPQPPAAQVSPIHMLEREKITTEDVLRRLDEKLEKLKAEQAALTAQPGDTQAAKAGVLRRITDLGRLRAQYESRLKSLQENNARTTQPAGGTSGSK